MGKENTAEERKNEEKKEGRERGMRTNSQQGKASTKKQAQALSVVLV